MKHIIVYGKGDIQSYINEIIAGKKFIYASSIKEFNLRIKKDTEIAIIKDITLFDISNFANIIKESKLVFNEKHKDTILIDTPQLIFVLYGMRRISFKEI